MHPDAAERKRSVARAALLTPVDKVWLSDSGVEITSLAIQVYGGMGYVEESGLPQLYRDARITPIYEGTNGVQALDLVTRKLPMDGGAVVRAFLDEMRALDSELSAAGEPLSDLRAQLSASIEPLHTATEWLLERSESDPAAVAAAATPYTRMFAVVTGGYFLARSAVAALARIEAGEGAAFARNKLATVRYFAEQILPSAAANLPAVMAGAEPLFAIDADDF
jgi:hypothetical protein